MKGKTKTQTCDQASVGKMKGRTDLSFQEMELHALQGSFHVLLKGVRSQNNVSSPEFIP